MASVSGNADSCNGENDALNSVDNSEVRSLMVSGNSGLEESQWTKARQTFTKAMLLNGICSSDKAALYCGRSLALMKVKDYENALEDADKAVELQPDWWKGHFRMGQVHCLIHLYKKAKKCFELAREKDPSQVEVNQAMRLVEMKLRQLDSEESGAEQEIALDLGKMSLDEYTRTDFLARKGEVLQSLEVRDRVIGQMLYNDVEKRSRQSELFGRVLRCLNHSIEVMYLLNKAKNKIDLPMPLYKKLIEELSAIARLEVLDGDEVLGKFHSQACSVVNHLLAMKTVFHESTCVCYAYLYSGTRALSTVMFLDTCIEQYPLNSFFLSARANLLLRLHSYREGLRDSDAALKLDPSPYERLYDRAIILENLYPSVSMQATIDAYRKFLARAPKDHPFTPAAYFNMSRFYYRISANSRNHGRMMKNLRLARLNYALGCDAEKVQSCLYVPNLEKLFLSLALL